MSYNTAAEVQFHTSSLYAAPKGYTAWKIRNDYPPNINILNIPRPGLPIGLPPGEDPTPWRDIDPKTDPTTYLECVKDYFLEGMIESDFVLQNNTSRQWYHASWLHYSTDGREPIRGLTSEGTTPPYNLGKNQSDYLASWSNAFFNFRAATTLGKIWADPNKPQPKGVLFPKDSVLIKTLFTTATDEQLPSMKYAPEWKAEIAIDPNNPAERNDFASTVRLIQMDVAVKDPRGPLGWIFGTFWYNGLRLADDYKDGSVRDQWDRLLPVGLMWGNDPDLTQLKYNAGERPKESWVNPKAKALLSALGGKRPFLGWNDRMNGPADSFISSCLSCHSVAQVNVPTPPPEPSMLPCTPREVSPGVWKPDNDADTMFWFRNIWCGQPFTEGALSMDFSMQARTGLKNYYQWRRDTGDTLSKEEERLGGQPVSVPRSGPDIKFL